MAILDGIQCVKCVWLSLSYLDPYRQKDSILAMKKSFLQKIDLVNPIVVSLTSMFRMLNNRNVKRSHALVVLVLKQRFKFSKVTKRKWNNN